MKPERTALVTGASGLLGRELTKYLNARGVSVLAQFYRNEPPVSELLVPLYGDLSLMTGVERFWHSYRDPLCRVDFFFSNYGPMTSKKTEELEYEDMAHDLTAHLAPLMFLVRRLRAHGRLIGVMGSSILELGEGRGYRNILAHACAKSALEMVIASWRLVWPEFIALSWPIPSLQGARFPHAEAIATAPEIVAREMVDALMNQQEKDAHHISS